MTTAIERAREAIKATIASSGASTWSSLYQALVELDCSCPLAAAYECTVAGAGAAAALCVEAWQASRPREEVREEAEAAVKAAFLAAPQYIAERLYRHWKNGNIRMLFDDLLDVGGEGAAPTPVGLAAIEAVARWKRAEMEAGNG